MLVVTMTENESVMIGHDVKVTVMRTGNGKIRLGIDAPGSTQIHRKGVYDRLQAGEPLKRAVARERGRR